jgi:serine/threonine protein kinase/Tol biopolymer transport system component
MNPERLQQIEKLFHSALKREPAERAAFLVVECGDDDSLRRAVESLLAHHEQAESFMESPASVAASIFENGKDGVLAGQSIGHYEILELLGAGGMGEVYLAHDVSLGRKVALKLLPAFYTQDADRLGRFEQEARAASALNHPTIITIYEIGHVDAYHFIATEYLEGATLRAHLATTRIKASEALDIAVQVASALAAAHAKGIVHRDIKPDNIMVLKNDYSLHRENYIKVLDFGIAKLTEAGALDAEAPTKPLINTNQGVVLGTVSYMSPEQARATTVDARTDIWSLGVVLYEMLTGKLPFEGETAEDVRAAILRDTVSPLSSAIPERLKWIVEKALRKDREDRFQTARELFSDLRELQKLEASSEALREHSVAAQASDGESVTGGPSAIASTATNSTNQIATPQTSSAEYIVNEIRRHKQGVLITAAVLLLMIGGLAYGLVGLWRHQQPSAKGSSQSMKITRLTDSGNATAAAISPDGKYVVYVREDEGKAGLWLKQVGQATEREIVSPTDGQIVGPTFSRDGSLIYYTASPAIGAESGVLYQIPTLGGTSRKVSENIFGPVGLSSDGKRLAFIRTVQGAYHVYSLIVADIDGTGEQTLLRKEGPAYLDNGPTWSPDGKTIVCGAAVGPDFLFESIVVIPVDGGQERWMTPHRWSHVSSTVWLGDGSGLMVLALENHTSELQLWHISYPGGEVQRVTNDLNGYLEGSLSITADSSAIVAAQEDRTSRIWVAPMGKGEDRARQLTLGKFDGLNGVAWTPDGKILCVLKTGDDSNIWLMNPDGTERKQLTADSAVKTLPQMSPDGHHIVFDSVHGESTNIWRMDADGSNQKQLTRGAFGDLGPRFTPDGQWVVFWSWTESGSGKIEKVSIDGGDPVPLTDYWTVFPTISPDGKLIAAGYLDEQQIPHLAIIPSLGGQPTKILPLISTVVPGVGLGWTPDSSTLVYVQKRSGVSNIWSQPINGDPPKQLTNFKSDLIFRFALSRDGREFVLARGTRTRDVVLIRDFR